MRYYYNCHLKAAYMQKYFAMEFSGIDFQKNISPIKWANKLMVADKIYIHPNSLYLLEPYYYDLVQISNNIYTEINSSLTMSEILKTKKKIKIIYRRNHSFMWPEYEE